MVFARGPIRLAYDGTMRFGFFGFISMAIVSYASGASAHLADEFPQVMLQVSVDEEAVALVVTIPAKVAKLSVFDGLSPLEMDRMEPTDLNALIGPVFAERCPVSIDGVVVPPTVVGAVVDMSNSRLPARRFPEPQVLKQGALKFLARYETKGQPRRVSLDWSIFANAYDADDEPIYAGEGLQVVGLVDAAGKQQVILLTPSEPGYVWHAEDASAVPVDLSVSTAMRRDARYIPIAPIAVLVIGTGVCLVMYQQRRGGRWPVAAGTIAVAVLAYFVVEIGVTYEPEVARLDDAEAIAIFESLHRNIYRAFDYTDEGAVYDALAQSVDGVMLDTIYNDVYQSLIMRDQNGAVSKVVRVEVDDAFVIDADDETIRAAYGGAAYEVRCNWRVDGLVTHFGHSHSRTNAFSAVYTVAPREAGWRIVGAEIIEQRRIDDGSQPPAEVLGAS